MKRWRLIGWAFVAIGALLGSMVLVAMPATATSTTPATATATLTGITGPGLGVSGDFAGGHFDNHFAGLLQIHITGTNGVTYAFCIELSVPLFLNNEQSVTLTEEDWNNISAAQDARLKANLPQITYILNHFAADGNSSNVHAAAVNSAIWHFSDGFNVDTMTLSNATQQAAVRSEAHDIVAAATSNGTGQPPSPKLSVTPSTLTGVTGATVGPYSVALVGAPSATIAHNAGTEVIDCATKAAVTTAANGDKLCLRRATDGEATMTLSAQGELPSGRIFVDATAPNSRQKIILANSISVPLTAGATATFAPTSTSTTSSSTTSTSRPTSSTSTSSTTSSTSTSTSTTSSTSTSTTSTSVAPASTSTTSTSVAPTTTTTAPVAVLPVQITPDTQPPTATAPQTVGTLPLTGRRSVSTVLLALTFLVIGGMLLFFSRPDAALATVGAPAAAAGGTAWRDDLRRQMPWWLRRSRPRQ